MGSKVQPSDSEPPKKKSNKKCIIWSVIITLVLLGAAGAVVGVILYKKNHNGDDPTPGPDPNPPRPPIVGVNPYYFLDDGKYTETQSMVSGTLEVNDTVLESLRSQKIQLKDQQSNVGLLDPLGIPIGKNNKLVKKIHFEAGQADDLVSYLRMDDDTNPRFSVPDDIIS
jgi:hypothetical protein